MKHVSFFGIIFFAALSRLIPHPPNFTPIGAMALYAGANITGSAAIILPLAAMFFSDLILGFHATMIFVYGSFVLTALIGRALASRRKVRTIMFASFSSSVLFFLITNFGVWLTSGIYAPNFQDLMRAYTMGIPFFRNTVLGDIFFTAVFFWGVELLFAAGHFLKSRFRFVFNKLI